MPISVEEIAEEWGTPTFRVPVPEARFTEFRGRVPNFLLEVWRKLGYSGFKGGLWWLCDPVAWQPSVDTWTTGIELPFRQDDWIAVARSAFGQLSLWGARTGMSLTIAPYYGWIFPDDRSDRMSTEKRRDTQVYSTLCSYEAETIDLIGDDDRYIFDRVLSRLGPVGIDTVYGFVPALTIGGTVAPEHVELLDAEVHLQILREISDIQLMVDNPYP